MYKYKRFLYENQRGQEHCAVRDCNKLLVTIPDSTVLLASLKASETSKFWPKSSALAGIVQSKVFETSQVLAEGIEYTF